MQNKHWGLKSLTLETKNFYYTASNNKFLGREPFAAKGAKNSQDFGGVCFHNTRDKQLMLTSSSALLSINTSGLNSKPDYAFGEGFQQESSVSSRGMLSTF